MNKWTKSIMRKIYRSMPPEIRDKILNLKINLMRARTQISYFSMDIVDWLLGRQEPLVPPRRIIYKLGWKDPLIYKKSAEAYIEYLIEQCALKPNESFLDIGCGAGRIAIPLTRYLGETGSYEGFDIFKAYIDWCKKVFAKYPNFRFQHVDLYNKYYNPKGKFKASEFTFPFQNESFGFVLAHSVFTHMLPQDAENYLREIARVLKKDGRCFITFFLLNKESLQLINARKGHLNFRYDFGRYRTISNDSPEAAVCYDEAFVLGLYEKYGLKIKQPISYGSWCGRSNFLLECMPTYTQDIIIASKG